MDLIIAEKPVLALACLEGIEGDKIEKFNGYYKKGNTYSTWAIGHLLEFKEPEELDKKYEKWDRSHLPIYFEEWEKRPKIIKKPKNKEETEEAKIKRERNQEGIKYQVDTIKKLLNDPQVKRIIHAGDPDEEGQYLIDELLEYFNNKKPVLRVLINDNNPEKVKQAFAKMESNDNFLSLGRSAYARSFADMLYGINGTRYFTLINPQVKGTLRLGRVLIPTLGLIVNRYKAIKNHEKTYFYELFSAIDINKKTNTNEKEEYLKIAKTYEQEFVDEEKRKELQEKLINEYERLSETPQIILKFNPLPELLENGKVLNRQILEDISKELQGTYEVIITKEIKRENAPLPFNLLELQKYANKKWGYTGDQVMEITQSLRDKYKAITYNRSDCQYLSLEHYKEAPVVIPQVIKNLNIVVPSLDFNIKSKCFNDKNITAHHGIIPTNVDLDLSKLDDKQRNIYTVISNFYISQFLPNLIKEETRAATKILETLDLSTTSTKVLDYGFKNFLNEKLDEEQDNETSVLSSLYSGKYEFKFGANEIKEKETTPPKLYTEGTLLNDMSRISVYVEDKELQKILKERDRDKKGENGGIGTPATRSSIIKNLFLAGYVILQGKNIIPTELGIKYFEYLPEELKKADLTAKWWVIQEEIIQNQSEPIKLILNVLETVSTIISKDYRKMDYTGNNEGKNIEELGKCPLCGKNVFESKISYYCEGYKNDPKCNFTIWKENKATNSKISESQAKNLLVGKNIIVKGEKYKLVNGFLKKEVEKLECPKCKKELKETPRTYNCDCSFTFWKNEALSFKDIKELFKGKSLDIYGLKNKEGKSYDANICLKEDFTGIKINNFLNKK
ncbi:DNA topoisomerase [Cetobacterium sp.]|uniref:type IA DNA topoisomerase n=1 Tax=Cetobacterium sp. TaxID=2071632 RepID=UPI003F2E9801